jgi:hypothetical protein
MSERKASAREHTLSDRQQIIVASQTRTLIPLSQAHVLVLVSTSVTHSCYFRLHYSTMNGVHFTEKHSIFIIRSSMNPFAQLTVPLESGLFDIPTVTLS